MKKLSKQLLSFATTALLAGAANAGTIAGWDFSQYLGDGLLTLDGATGANTLSANYSNLDPTFGSGAESAAYGTMYINGQFGSSDIDPFASPTFLPTAGSLNSNLNAPITGPGVPAGAVPFETFGPLVAEGQLFANPLGMTAVGLANVVFQATTLGANANSWGLTFGGKTFSGASAIGVSYSLDGLSYSAPTVVNLDTNDTPFSVAFTGVTASQLYVRLALSNLNGQPIIDNVSLNATPVPEPGTLVVFAVAMAGLGLVRRRSV